MKQFAIRRLYSYFETTSEDIDSGSFDQNLEALDEELKSLLEKYGLKLINCRIPDDHISQKRYPWFVARDVMQRAIEQFIQQAQGDQPT